MSNATEFNPLIARQRRSRNLRLGLAAGFAATIVLLLGARVNADPVAAAPAAMETARALSTEAPSAAEKQAKPARQVRVIPLWNASADKDGRRS